MTKDIITSVIILLLLIAFVLWSIAHNIKESIVDVTFAIEKMSAEIRRVRESMDGLREETAKLRIQAMKEKPDDHKVEEIVRCKDCKCWHPQFKTENGNGLGSCDFHDVALVTSKGFCYWAERKENDQRRSD